MPLSVKVALMFDLLNMVLVIKKHAFLVDLLTQFYNMVVKLKGVVYVYVYYKKFYMFTLVESVRH